MTETVSTRSSRNRRAVALMGWGCLVATAFVLWNARQTGTIRAVTAEPMAFILAAFAAFVGVFAWMLYNPGRRASAESPSLFFAAGATLFPPSIIGFCLMPIDSPLRWWLALGLFLLCVIAVLSHVPDEFFGVPRARHTYLTPIPAFDRVAGTVLDPNASWFKLEDLTRIVSDTERPSLAPRAYLQRETTVRAAAPVRAEIRPVTEVDDILGSDFDLGLLDDTVLDEREFSSRQEEDRRQNQRTGPQQSGTQNKRRFKKRLVGREVYSVHNPESTRLKNSALTRPDSALQQLPRATQIRSLRHAQSLQVEPVSGRRPYSSDRSSEADSSSTRSVEGPPKPNPTAESRRSSGSERQSSRRKELTPNIDEQRSTKPDVEARETEVPERRVSRYDQRESRQQGSSVRTPASGFAAVPVPVVPSTSPQATREESVAAPQQLFGQTIQRDSARRDTQTRQGTDSSSRRSRYEEKEVRSEARPSTAEERPAVAESPSSATLKSPHEAFQRTKDEDGSELVEGVMKVHFDKGQKRANIHIPFSPPLPGMPEVECEAVGGEGLRLKVPVRQSYGIRIEARRSSADEPLDADIGFAAVYNDE